MQSAFSSLKAVLFHLSQYPSGFIHPAAEGYHHYYIIETHDLPDSFEGGTLQGKALSVPITVVSRCSPEPQHGIILLQLKESPADEVGVFVRLEIAQPNYNRPRVKGGGYGPDSHGELLYEVLLIVTKAKGQIFNLLSCGLVCDHLRMDQGHGMNLNVAGYYELQAGQAHSVIGDHGCGESLLRVAQVYHDLGLGPGQVLQAHLLDTKRQYSFVDHARIALCAADCYLLAGLDLLHGPGCAHHSRNPELPADYGGMAGSSPQVGHDSGSLFHDRLPVRGCSIGDQHLSRLE